MWKSNFLTFLRWLGAF